MMALDQFGIPPPCGRSPSAYVSVSPGVWPTQARSRSLMPPPSNYCALPQLELIWAARARYSIFSRRMQSGATIITATGDILKKLNQAGKDLHEFSLKRSGCL